MQFRTDPNERQAATDWPATREAALARLERFLPHAGGDYAARRNYDLGPDQRDNVSVLSPYIRHRLITEQEVAARAIAAHGIEGADIFLKEVCWRTYWKGWLEMRPGVWDRYTQDVTHLSAEMARDADLALRVEAARGGATGIACFDAWVSELVATGYLHNHARMWFASIWIYTLELPWQLGADFFLKHLLDGDPASNTLSWRWMCGLHTRGKTYLARPANIDEFTGGRFRGIQGLANAAPARTEPVAPETAAPLVPRGTPPAGDVVLLVTEDDLSPETLDLGGARVRRIVVADVPTAYSAASARVRRFKALALADAAERAARAFWCPVELVKTGAPSAIDTLAKMAGPLPVVLAAPPVGPSRAELEPVIAALRARGVATHPLRRDWDDAFWPLATAGFFQLASEIPAVVTSLGLAR